MNRLTLPFLAACAACTEPPSTPEPTDTDTAVTEPSAPTWGPVELRLQGVLADEGVAYVHDVDGTYLDQVAIDVAGYAHLPEVPAGGQVTVAQHIFDFPSLITVHDVQPGEPLVMGVAPPQGAPLILDVTYDASSIPEADGVRVSTGCTTDRGSMVDTSTLALRSDCLSQDNTLVALVLDDQDTLVAYAVRRFSTSDGDQQLSFDEHDWRTDFGTLRLIADVVEEGHVGLGFVALDGPGQLHQQDHAALATPGGTVLMSAPVVPAADRLLGFVEQWNGYSSQLSVFPIDGVPSAGEQLTVEFTLEGLTLPSLDEAVVSTDGRTATVGTSRSDLHCAAAGEADVAVWGWTAEAADGTFRYWRTIRAPGEAQELTLPDLGPDAQLWWPESVQQYIDLTLVAHESLDYAQLRGTLADVAGQQSLYRPLGPSLCMSFSSPS